MNIRKKKQKSVVSSCVCVYRAYIDEGIGRREKIVPSQNPPVYIFCVYREPVQTWVVVYFSIFWPVPPSWHRAQSAQLVSSLHVPFVGTCCFCFSPTQSSSSSFLHPRGELVTITLTRVPSRVGCCPQEKKRETKQNTKKNNGQIIIIKTKKLDFPFRVVVVVVALVFCFFQGTIEEKSRGTWRLWSSLFLSAETIWYKDDEFNLVIFHRDFTPSIDRHVHRSQLYYLANGLCPYRKENRLAVTGW